MKVCICRDFNECNARKALAAMSPELLSQGFKTVSEIVTGKPVQCGQCKPDWTKLIKEAEITP